MKTQNYLELTNDNFIKSYVKLCHNYLYQIVPYLIIWKSNSIYFIHTDLKFLLYKLLAKPLKRFILLKLTIVTTDSLHSNILLFDKKIGTLERFEPYGQIRYDTPDNIDDFLKSALVGCFEPYFKEYVSPSDLFSGIGLQTISSENSEENRKITDPIGYCLAWCNWYIEMRVTHEDIHPRDLMKIYLNNIIGANKEIEATQLFISFIRNYAKTMSTDLTKMMENAGINSQNIIDMKISDSNIKLIKKYLSKEFNLLQNDLYLK